MIWPQRLAELDSYVLSHVTQRAHRLLCDHLDTTGLRMQHYRVMAGLDELAECTQADLGRALGVDAGTLVSVLAELERQGAVTREPDPSSRRRNLVRPTEVGERMLREMDEAVGRANDVLLAPLNTAERRQLHRLLGQIVPSPQAGESQREIDSDR
ncbi:MAG: MarR family transcriptional regulator [Actinomycetota bacterium]|nr:MarR family transcriptional regulator [Actinomycetota bacterium]MDQ2959404.1 MarR family transcriptional regulator [Actinomycetota bacterium]